MANLRVIIGVFIVFLASSCMANFAKYGKVELYNNYSTVNVKSGSRHFTFRIREIFEKKYGTKERDEKHPILSKSEADLLNKIMKKEGYCLDFDEEPSYVITSKQEKIYDITFANLIEQNYNARPVSPKTFFGKCI